MNKTLKCDDSEVHASGTNVHEIDSSNLRMNSPQEVFEIITAIKICHKEGFKRGRKILAMDILFACKRKVKATKVHDYWLRSSVMFAIFSRNLFSSCSLVGFQHYNLAYRNTK